MANTRPYFKMNNSRQQIRSWGHGLLATTVLLLIYVWTLQKDINGSSHNYLLDTGEIQVALNLWGTIHYTGYPHYTILSTLLTQAARGLGLSPAMAASATSLFWSLLGLLIFYRLLWHVMKGNSVLAGLVVTAVGMVETFWIHSVIAEVYSFSLFLVSLAIFLGIRLHDQWHPWEWLLTVLVLGTAVAHHRLLLLLLPMVWVLLWPKLWPWLRQHPKYILYSLLTFLAPFLAYIYLPLRAWQGATWVYGQPQTWSGFWRQFTGNEVTGGLLRLPQNYQAWVDNFHFLAEHLTHQLPWGVLLLGLIGLLWLTREHPKVGLALLFGTAVFPLFVLLFPKAVWAPAVLIPSLLWVTVGIANGLHRLAQVKPILRPVSWAGLLLFSAFLLRANLPFVDQLTHESAGRDMISLLQSISDREQSSGKEPIVALPWGTGFFAAAYGQYVTRELPNLVLVDHRANFSAIMANEGSILTPGLYLEYWPPTWWQETVGEVSYSAVVPGIVAINQYMQYQDVPLDVNFDLGNGIRIRSAEISKTDKEKAAVTIYWEAMQLVEQDYSVAIHLVTRFPPQGPDDVVAMADSMHPVRGWYPTTQWSVSEVIRDQYELIMPAGTTPTAVEITMYRVGETGQFVNNEWFVIRLPDLID